MISRRTMILSVPFFAASLTACAKNRTTSPKRREEPRSSSSATAALAPSDPVDESFEGCAKSCGSRSKKDLAEARTQPGAAQGDAVHCPVSGAVFRITAKSPRRTARGNVLYFCCEACAAWFGEHEAEVLAKRALG